MVKQSARVSIITLLAIVLLPQYVFGAMLYNPPKGMWDTWLFRNGDEYHLFFMQHRGIGRAVSKDLIHWQPLPAIPNQADTTHDKKKGMTTGCTVKKGDLFYMFYGTGPKEPAEFLTSPDLVNWQRYPGNPVLPAKAPYRPGDHWRDLTVYYDETEKQWHGFLFGIEDVTSRPCIAHVTTTNFVDWQYLPPVFVSDEYTRDNDGFVYLEVPEHFVMNGRHYLMFSSVRSRKNHISGLNDAAGTWYLIGDRREGPYRVPKRPLILGSGEGRFDHYVGRTIEHEGQRLLYHQVVGNMGKNRVAWGTLKKVVQNPDGTLMLKYWPALDALRAGRIESSESLTVTADTGFRSLKMVDVSMNDFMLTCRLDLAKVDAAAVIWHDSDDASQNNACGLLLNRQTQKAALVAVEYWKKYHERFGSRTILTHMKTEYHQNGLIGASVDVRIIARGRLAEVYLNDRWLFTTDLSDLPQQGVFGFLADSGELAVSDIRIDALEPMTITGSKK